MLIDMMNEVEQKVGVTPRPAPSRPRPADKEVIEVFISRLRRQILAELAAEKTAESSEGGVVISAAGDLGLDQKTPLRSAMIW